MKASMKVLTHVNKEPNRGKTTLYFAKVTNDSDQRKHFIFFCRNAWILRRKDKKIFISKNNKIIIARAEAICFKVRPAKPPSWLRYNLATTFVITALCSEVHDVSISWNHNRSPKYRWLQLSYYILNLITLTRNQCFDKTSHGTKRPSFTGAKWTQTHNL